MKNHKMLSFLLCIVMVLVLCIPLVSFAATGGTLAIALYDTANSPIANVTVVVQPDSNDTYQYEQLTNDKGIANFTNVTFEDCKIFVLDNSGTQIGVSSLNLYTGEKTEIMDYAMNHYEISVNKNASGLGLSMQLTGDGKMQILGVADNVAPIPAPTLAPTLPPAPNTVDIKMYLMNTDSVALSSDFASLNNVIKSEANGDGAVFFQDVSMDTHTLKVFNKSGKQLGACNMMLMRGDASKYHGKDQGGVYEVYAKNGTPKLYMSAELASDGTLSITQASDQPLQPGSKPSQKDPEKEKDEEKPAPLQTNPFLSGYFIDENGMPLGNVNLKSKNLDTQGVLNVVTGKDGSFKFDALSQGNHEICASHGDHEFCSVKFIVEVGSATGLTEKNGQPLLVMQKDCKEIYMNLQCSGKTSISILGVSNTPLNPPAVTPTVTDTPAPAPADERVFTLHGKVSDAAKNPVSNGSVSVSADGIPTQINVRTDADGIFMIEELPTQKELSFVVHNDKNVFVCSGVVLFQLADFTANNAPQNNVLQVSLAQTTGNVYMQFVGSDSGAMSISAISDTEFSPANKPAQPKSDNTLLIVLIIAVVAVLVILVIVLLNKNKSNSKH
ncbi:MAG: carboxypeptidase-like regulatory domain-containing protein [Christensenellaceae bacterium]